MTKTELAHYYLPYYEARSALNRLMSWIRQTPGLMPALVQTGYQTRQKTLTPQQVEIIQKYFGCLILK